MRHANVSIVLDLPGRPLLIRDEGPWDRHPTATNDAEWVVQDFHARGLLAGDRRLWYVDSEGAVDELLHVGGRFTGYASVPVEDVEDLRAKGGAA